MDPEPDRPLSQGYLARIERLASGRGGVALIAVWAFTEAMVVPVVPDVALGLLVLVAPRRAAVLFAALLVASLLGTLVLFTAVTLAPDALTNVILALPGIPEAMLADARTTVATGDPTALALFGPGTPLKVYTLAWAMGPATVLQLLAGVVMNRLSRVGPGLVAMTVIGLVAPSFLRRHERPVLIAYSALWIAVYATYLS